MKSRLLWIVVLPWVLLTTSTTFAGPNINPGQWEFTTKTEMQGAAAMQVPPETHTQCITKDDLVPMSQGASQQCKIRDVVSRGDTTSWKISCGGQGGQMEGTGKVTYNGNSMTGTMQMVIAGSNMTVTNRITGRRIGECSGSRSSSTSSTPPAAQTEASAVDAVIAEDARDVGQAAHDEVKESSLQEMTKGIRGLFGKILK